MASRYPNPNPNPPPNTPANTRPPTPIPVPQSNGEEQQQQLPALQNDDDEIEPAPLPQMRHQPLTFRPRRHAMITPYATNPSLNPTYRASLIRNALLPAHPATDDGHCPICIRPYGDDTVALNPCDENHKHVFCRECITTWLREPPHNKCPMCRTALWEEDDGKEVVTEQPPLVWVPNVPVGELGGLAMLRPPTRRRLSRTRRQGVVLAEDAPQVQEEDDSDDEEEIQPARQARVQQDEHVQENEQVQHAQQDAQDDQIAPVQQNDHAPALTPTVSGSLDVGHDTDQDAPDSDDDGPDLVIIPGMMVPPTGWHQIHWLPSSRADIGILRATTHRYRFGRGPSAHDHAAAARLRAHDDRLAARGRVELLLVDVPSMALALFRLRSTTGIRLRSPRMGEVVNAMLRQAALLQGRMAAGYALFALLVMTARSELLRRREVGVRAGLRRLLRPARPVRELDEEMDDWDRLPDGLDVAAEVARRLVEALAVVRIAVVGEVEEVEEEEG